MKNKTFSGKLCAGSVRSHLDEFFQKQASGEPSPSSPCGTIWAFYPCCPCFLYASPQGPRRLWRLTREVERWHGRRFWLASLGSQPCQLGRCGAGADRSPCGRRHQGRLHRIRLHRTECRCWTCCCSGKDLPPGMDRHRHGIVGLYLLCISDGFSLDVNDAAIMASTLCFALHILMWSRFSPHVDALPFMVVEFLHRYPVRDWWPSSPRA